MRAHRDTCLRLLSLFAAGASLLACDQPSPTCNIARGPFSARYTLVPGSVTGSGDCGELVGEELWVSSYTQPKPGSSTPDPDHVKIGIIATTLNDLQSRAECSGVASSSPETPYALGAFASAKPDKDDFCHVPVLTPSQVTLPALESCQADPCQPPLAAEPAHDVRYEWSNVRVYVTASANGTQFAADLKYTSDGCSAQYKVTALYPSVSCAGFPVMEMNPATGDDAGADGSVADSGLGGMDAGLGPDAALEEPDAALEEDAGEWVRPDDCDPPPEPGTVPDQTLCSQDAPMTGDLTGSNINPDFMVQCDPQQLRCVLSTDPPSLR